MTRREAAVLYIRTLLQNGPDDELLRRIEENTEPDILAEARGEA